MANDRRILCDTGLYMIVFSFFRFFVFFQNVNEVSTEALVLVLKRPNPIQPSSAIEKKKSCKVDDCYIIATLACR